MTPFYVDDTDDRFCPIGASQGRAAVIANWAEFQIFGGVVHFDRGESGDEASLQILARARLMY